MGGHMNKNKLWSQPNVARKANNSATLHSGYEVGAMREEYGETCPLNLAGGLTAQWSILDYRDGYATAFSGDAKRVGNAMGGRHA